MNMNIAGDMAGTGQKAGVVAAGRIEPGGHGRYVHEFPDLDLRADRQAVFRQCHTHRSREDAKVRIEMVPLIPDDNQFASLISGDQKRSADLPQNRGEVWGVYRLKGD